MLIKTGQMTPFGGIVENAKGTSDSRGAITEQFLQDSGLETERLLDEHGENKNRRTQNAHGKSLVRSLADNRESDNDDDNDEYVPDDSELKYSWYEDENEVSEKRQLGKGKSAASKRSLNVAYREDDGYKPKKKKKITRGRRKAGTRPVDDGNEKMYRQRIR